MTCRNSLGIFEEVTGPMLYGWMNGLDTYSTTSFVIIVRHEPAYFTLSPSEQVRLILAFYGFTKTQLAQIIGISRPALYAWLDGTSEPESANHDKLSCMAQLAHDVDAEPAFPLFHGYITRPIPGYDKSLIDYMTGTLTDRVLLSRLIKKIADMTVERRDRLQAMPKPMFLIEEATLDENLDSLSDGA